jgi:hypothetical protein
LIFKNWLESLGTLVACDKEITSGWLFDNPLEIRVDSLISVTAPQAALGAASGKQPT